MNSMSKEQLFRAIGGIDDALLQDTEDFLAYRCARRSRRNRPARFLWKGVGAAAAAAACAAVLSFPFPTEPAASSGSTSAPSSAASSPAGGQPPLSIEADINESGAPGGAVNQINLMGEDFTPMPYDELLDYFGIALPVEEALPGFRRVPPEGGYGVYRTADRGVYYDGNSVAFAAGEAGKERIFSVTLAKAFQHPYDIFLLSEDELRFTELNGRSLALFHYTDEDGSSCYYVEFLQNGVGYYVGTKNVSESDFLRGLAALVKASDPPAGGTRTVCGRVTVVDRTAQHIAIALEGGEEPVSLGIDLPPGEAENYALGDRITVTYTGEPATIATLWRQQILQIGPADGPEA